MILKPPGLREAIINPPGPRLWLPCDEFQSTPGELIQGTITSFAGAPVWGKDAYGTYLEFDGDDDYLSLGTIPAITQSAKFTLSLWVYLTQTPGTYDQLFSCVTSANWNDGGWGCYVPSSGNIDFFVYDYLTNFSRGSLSSDGLWHHICATYDLAEVALYVDGVASTADAYTGGIGSPGEMRIGSSLGSANRGMPCRVRDVRFYSRRISYSEVKTLYEHRFRQPKSNQSRLILIPAASGSTGTAAITLANDTVAATGVVPSVASLAITLANDTVAATGKAVSVGTAAITLANDTVAAVGETGSVSGSAAITLANDTVAGTGVVPSVAAASITLANDTVAATGIVVSVGTAAITLANDTVAAIGAAGTASGSIAITLTGDSVVARGAGAEVATGGSGWWMYDTPEERKRHAQRWKRYREKLEEEEPEVVEAIIKDIEPVLPKIAPKLLTAISEKRPREEILDRLAVAIDRAQTKRVTERRKKEQKTRQEEENILLILLQDV